MAATSSNHAELLAIHEASRECIWLRSVIQHIRESCGISSISDNPTLQTACDKLHNNLSQKAAVVWLFVALAITSSCTASLTSFLTIQNRDPLVTNVETLRKTRAKVGCNGNSFVVKYLENVLKFEPQNIEKIYVEDNYSVALKSGKIAANFLGVPYMKVLLAKNCKGFMVGESFKVGGSGFLFLKDASLLSDISQAVLNVSESGTLLTLEESMLKSYTYSKSEDDYVEYSLRFDIFWGLFAITL
ncbi:glutamate receptor 3.3-like [Apium graveolens]|uniref:glutamate receptor 3.3-like n=1 Tax=Apium graveolens TaxID=4045 RepID=UPI003D7AC1C4